MYKQFICYFILILNSSIANSQIQNKWYKQYALLFNDTISFNLIPPIIEITDKTVNYYDQSGEIYFSFDLDYKNQNKSLILYDKGGRTRFSFNVDSISNNLLNIRLGDVKICFKRIINYDSLTGALKLISNNDTITKYLKIAPKFNGDFTSYLIKNLDHFKYADTVSQMVKVSFLIKNSGFVTNIKVETLNEELKNDLTNLINGTSGKWKIDKKFKSFKENTMDLNIIVMSNVTKSLAKQRSKKTGEILFNKGYSYHQKNDYKNALFYYTESIKYFNYVESLYLSNLNSVHDFSNSTIRNSAILNRAAIYYEMGLIDRACEEWNLVVKITPKSSKDFEEASSNITKFCK